MNHAVLMCICTCAKIGFCLETSLKDQHRFKANNHSSIICWALVIRSEGSKKIPSSQVCTTIRLPHLRLWFFCFFLSSLFFPSFAFKMMLSLIHVYATVTFSFFLIFIKCFMLLFVHPPTDYSCVQKISRPHRVWLRAQCSPAFFCNCTEITFMVLSLCRHKFKSFERMPLC